ncbi:probable mitochondrial import inner membrane translocase subunit TIM21 [Neltuma alba]|uniref:probable mitochondrial import inner membrane translocase subunit TIM21 n=1 Tax=Neltuma alba TaxID=207710 RepID=UPI0010A4AF08|nr:probable mitochondrial import inner membrane translocase subunit TIM21 [Prosopis alba]XP_028765574.1 probable mitochondrial import inner membrane translocase subunit TIM21 [Prosopis alba]XP_028765575.1 probable mitochondrial import inner membrane translocase subunit TIM21 [Prosopis alba]XP_028794803.1 probable mitochondrial import inner membrane translocase subunit TIM21 [Prosopis alba]XP_028794805.1 probable mitochondrial import inner membrane translocase subunit TIM21 [Prosopis alba]XP_02
MGASKYFSDLWRSRQLYDVELLSNLRHWRYATTRSLVQHTRPLQPADIPRLGQVKKDIRGANGMAVQFSGWFAGTCTASFQPPYLPRVNHEMDSISFPCVRSISSRASNKQGENTNETKKDISTVEDPFDAPTYNIPEKPVTFVEGASYSVVILVGLGIAAAAGYAVFKELIFEPKEYKIFNTALERIQNDSQVRVRIGSPITGYGQESRNRAARQRIPNKVWTDEGGVEHVEVNFYIRGPHGSGKVFCEMFKDQVDKRWKFTYLIVEIRSPSPAQLILESYIPA